MSSIQADTVHIDSGFFAGEKDLAQRVAAVLVNGSSRRSVAGDRELNLGQFPAFCAVSAPAEQPMFAREAVLEQVCAFPHSIHLGPGTPKYVLTSRIIPGDLVPVIQQFINSSAASLPVYGLQTDGSASLAIYSGIMDALEQGHEVPQQLDSVGLVNPAFWVGGIVPQVVLTHKAQPQILITDIDSYGRFTELYGSAAATVALGEIARVVQEEIAREYNKDGWRVLRRKKSGRHYWIPDPSLFTSRAGSGDDMYALTIGLDVKRQQELRGRITSRVGSLLIPTICGSQPISATTVMVPYDSSQPVLHNMRAAHCALLEQKDYNRRTGRIVTHRSYGVAA